MHISTTIPLVYFGTRERTNAMGFPSDLEIQQTFESWGFGIRRQLLSDGEEVGQQKLEHIHPGETAPTKSTLHYRDMACGAIKGSGADQSIEREIKRFCIFYGALPRFRSHIYVNRVSSGWVTVYVSAEDLGIAASSFLSLISKIGNSERFDRRRIWGSEVKIYSLNKSDVVATGKLTSWNGLSFWRYIKTDAILFAIVTFLSAIYIFLEESTFAQSISFFETHSSAIFQSLAASWIILLISLLIQALQYKHNPISWNTLDADQ